MKKRTNFFAGLILSVALTFLLVLILALAVKIFSLSSSVIRPINQFIKTVAVLVGAIYCVKEKGILKGILFGIVYSLLTNLIFGLISGGLSFDKSLLLDLLFCLFIGGISGVIGVNIKRKGA